MPQPTRQVLCFKVTLRDTEPSIWRRIVVPEDYSFWALHTAIQNAMGWLDSHLHAFEVIDPARRKPVRIGIPAEDDWEPDETFPGWKRRIARYFPAPGAEAVYTYDFGDGWEHDLVMERRSPAADLLRFPMCIDGARRCPPEDCGGVGGYEHFLSAISDPSYEDHDDLLRWVGGSFDPEAFEASSVRFDDPAERLARLLTYDEI